VVLGILASASVGGWIALRVSPPKQGGESNRAARVPRVAGEASAARTKDLPIPPQRRIAGETLSQPQENAPRGEVPTVAPKAKSEAFRWDGRYLSRLAPQQIKIDGNYEDWDKVPALPDLAWDVDARRLSRGSGVVNIPNPDVDIRQWKFTNDTGNLYVYVEVAPEGVVLTGAPDAADGYFLMVHLDVDDNMDTGFRTFDGSLPADQMEYTDWYYPSNIGSDYAFEVGYGNPPAHAPRRFRTFITYWGAGEDKLGWQTYQGMEEIRDDWGVVAYKGNRLEMGFPFKAFGGHVRDGAVMDVALSVEAAGEARGLHWCQDSTEAIDDYTVHTEPAPSAPGTAE